MASVKENDLMIDFYLSPPILQREILDKYQLQKTTNKQCESLVSFLENKFKLEVTERRTKNTSNNRHVSQ